MIDEAREPRRAVGDIKNTIGPRTDLNRRLTIPTHPAVRWRRNRTLPEPAVASKAVRRHARAAF
jgi:hypothetical protein